MKESDCSCKPSEKPAPKKPAKPAKSKSDMTSKSERSMKNYLYDNKQLQECKIKSCLDVNLDLDDDDDNEIWMLQCPKSIDVNSLINCRIGKTNQNVQFDAEKFEECKTLMVIKPGKAEEYETICDNVKIVSLYCYENFKKVNL